MSTTQPTHSRDAEADNDRESSEESIGGADQGGPGLDEGLASVSSNSILDQDHWN